MPVQLLHSPAPCRRLLSGSGTRPSSWQFPSPCLPSFQDPVSSFSLVYSLILLGHSLQFFLGKKIRWTGSHFLTLKVWKYLIFSLSWVGIIFPLIVKVLPYFLYSSVLLLRCLMTLLFLIFCSWPVLPPERLKNFFIYSSSESLWWYAMIWVFIRVGTFHGKKFKF